MNNRLIHGKTLVWIKALHILQVIHLTLEESEVVSKHFPVELFSDKSFSLVFFILCFSSVVQIIVEHNEFLPLFVGGREVVYVLLSNIQKVFSACHVVKHDGSSALIEELLLEVVALIK